MSCSKSRARQRSARTCAPRLHVHLFLDTTEPENAGVDGNPPGEWYITDEPETDLTPFGPDTRGTAQQLCAVVANVDHSVFDPESGTCLDLP